MRAGNNALAPVAWAASLHAAAALHQRRRRSAALLHFHQEPSMNRINRTLTQVVGIALALAGIGAGVAADLTPEAKNEQV
ncbi:MAG TPA: hypothetical protein VLB69_12250, partial [Rudaea sp.]|nr:hypothetical protein [Rudaea sp.]